jgi:hypothetical protein
MLAIASCRWAASVSYARTAPPETLVASRPLPRPASSSTEIPGSCASRQASAEPARPPPATQTRTAVYPSAAAPSS